MTGGSPFCSGRNPVVVLAGMTMLDVPFDSNFLAAIGHVPSCFIVLGKGEDAHHLQPTTLAGIDLASLIPG